MMKGLKSIDNMTGSIFDKKQTNIVKGVAVLMLLWHHLFLSREESISNFISVASIGGVPIECLISTICKVCVSIFIFISGYGCVKSYSKLPVDKSNNKFSFNIIKNDLLFFKNRIIKLLFGLWFIYLIFVPLGFLFNRNPIEFYHGNVSYFILDFCGLSHLLGTPEFNPTWWYFSLAIVFYFLFPVLYKLLKICPELLLSVGVAFLLLPVPNYREIFTYLITFILGMYIAHRNGFEFINRLIPVSNLRIITVVLLVTAFGYFRLTVFGIIDSLFSFSVILLSVFAFSRIPILNKILEEFGKCSSYIFMFHTFFLLYVEQYVYMFKYSLLIYLVFVIVCFLIAEIIMFIQKTVRYDKLILKIIDNRNKGV